MKMKKKITKKQVTEKYLEMPWAEWQTKKRNQWRAVTDAISAFDFGSAYTPTRELDELQRIAARITEAMAEDWVSW